MEKEIKVTCPCCDTILIINRNSGTVLETRKPLVQESSGDRMSDAFTKMKQDRAAGAHLFDNMGEEMRKRKEAAESLFNESLKTAKESKEQNRPDSIFDRD